MKYFIVCMQKLKITVTFKILHTLTSLALQVHLLFTYTSTQFQQGHAHNSPSSLLCSASSRSSNALASHILPLTRFPSRFYQTSRFTCFMPSDRHSSLLSLFQSYLQIFLYKIWPFGLQSSFFNCYVKKTTHN